MNALLGRNALAHVSFCLSFSTNLGKPIDSDEPPRGIWQKLVFWGRVVASVAALGLALAVTLAGIFQGKTTMWVGVPGAVSVIVFFVLMALVGIMEGMQIALFAVINMPDEELIDHTIAFTNCKLAFRDQNLQAFLIGRQVCVTICMFVIARISTLGVVVGEDENIFGVSDGLQEFFNTGLLGAVVTTIMASLMWRIVASSFPVAFLSNPLIYFIIWLCMTLESSGICSAAWILGRWNKLLMRYQPDEVYLEGAEPHTKKPVTRRDKDIDVSVTVVKYAYSLALLLFSVTVVMAAIFTEQTTVSSESNALVAFFVLWALILWLALMEGGQGCLVGLQPVDKSLYCETHPVTLKSTKLTHVGDNMKRFIVGRQLVVVVVVFVVNLCGAPFSGAEVLNLSDVASDIFVTSGVALILMTTMLGQLASQVNAANCMLDFINTHFMLFTTWVSLFIEVTGLLHSVYLIQYLFAKVAGKTSRSEDEPPRTGLMRAFFWSRVFISVIALGFAFAVTLASLFQGKTMMWDGVPAGASIAIFFILMLVVGMLEGIQIALFSVVNLPEEEIRKHPLVHKTCLIAFKGSNLQAFLIGRQIFVTACMFIVARITTTNVTVGVGNIFGVSDSLQAFFNTGLLGALITTVVASLAWRVIASSSPITFLSNPLVYIIVQVCLLVEMTGICSASWMIALIHKHVVGYQLDETYIGTPDERAAASSSGEILDSESQQQQAQQNDVEKLADPTVDSSP